MALDETAVRAAINRIADPCSAARGVPIGLDDMGLVRAVRVVPTDGGQLGVAVQLRTTSPGCLFFLEWHQQIKESLIAAGAAWVTVDLDATFDWTPLDIAPSARARLTDQRVALRTRLP